MSEVGGRKGEGGLRDRLLACSNPLDTPAARA